MNNLLDNDEEIRSMSQGNANRKKVLVNLKQQNELKNIKLQDLYENYSFSKSKKPDNQTNDAQTSPVSPDYDINQAHIFKENECIVCDDKKEIFCNNCSEKSDRTIDFPEPCNFFLFNFRPYRRNEKKRTKER